MTSSTPFALGTFAASDGRAFAGLVLGDAGRRPRPAPRRRRSPCARSSTTGTRRCPRSRPSPTASRPTTRRPRPRRPAPAAAARAAGAGVLRGRELPPARARPDGRRRAPRGDSTDGLTAADRDRARAELDERARSGRPFVFMESRNAIVGARDDVVLPCDSEQHDWELELAAVIGRPGAPRRRASEALDVDRRLHDLQRRHDARRAHPHRRARPRARLARGQVRADVPPDRPAARPGRARRRPDGRSGSR